ncbi:hypothetical protein Hanom_Chr00s000003g01604491 [Helianthus anomalus]
MIQIKFSHDSNIPLLRFVKLEAKYSWNVALGSFLWLQMSISHQEQVRECGSKISTIYIYEKVKEK